MLLCLALACSGGRTNDPDYAETLRQLHAPIEPCTLETARLCAVIADDSPHAPSRLVFLYKMNGTGTDAQAELTQFDASRLRCGELHLAFPHGSDGMTVTFDFMPGPDPVTLRELRVYRFNENWNPNLPFLLASEDHAPFRDYSLHLDLLPDPKIAEPDPTIVLPH